MTSGAAIDGNVAEGWGKVADAFQANFAGEPGEVGAACCVYAGSRPVVDLWGGLADRETRRPWTRSTIAQVASTTKGATAICAHLLAQRGELDLDEPVARYWPEFGQAGKEHIPVRWLLSHQAGLPVVDASLTFADACAWEPVIRALEAQKPLWDPGTAHVYHAITFGFLVGELVRRISGKSLAQFFGDEIASPLGLRAWLSLPEQQEPDVATMHYAKPFTLEEMLEGMIALTGLDADTVTKWVMALWGEGSVQARAGSLGGALDNAQQDYFSPAYRAAGFGDSGLTTDAHSLARMYAATVSDIDGVRILQTDTVKRAIEVQTDRTRMYGLPAGIEVPADRSFYMSLGFWRSCAPMPMTGPNAFGHPGSGGSIGFADPDHELGFGYVMNLLAYGPEERRVRNLTNAVVACLG